MNYDLFKYSKKIINNFFCFRDVVGIMYVYIQKKKNLCINMNVYEEKYCCVLYEFVERLLFICIFVLYKCIMENGIL